MIFVLEFRDSEEDNDDVLDPTIRNAARPRAVSRPDTSTSRRCAGWARFCAHFAALSHTPASRQVRPSRLPPLLCPYALTPSRRALLLAEGT
jgi:hypothetical protein